MNENRFVINLISRPKLFRYTVSTNSLIKWSSIMSGCFERAVTCQEAVGTFARDYRQTSKTELPTTRESRFSKGNRRNAYAMLTVSRLSSIYIKILEEQKSEKLSEK